MEDFSGIEWVKMSRWIKKKDQISFTLRERKDIDMYYYA